MTQADRLAIRPFAPDDADAVAEIFAHYVRTTVISFETEPRSAAAWRAVAADLAGAGWPFLVGTVDEPGGPAVVGFSYVGPWRSKPAYSRTVETTVYLAPGTTGRGYGRLLLTAVLGAAAAAGARQVIAVIADSGDGSSLRLHSSLGFDTVGVLRQVGFKHDRWMDVTLMQLTLPDRMPGDRP
jgi:phosphinothricin acetyltransferase